MEPNLTTPGDSSQKNPKAMEGALEGALEEAFKLDGWPLHVCHPLHATAFVFPHLPNAL
jgi:hypothetical protein